MANGGANAVLEIDSDLEIIESIEDEFEVDVDEEFQVETPAVPGQEIMQRESVRTLPPLPPLAKTKFTGAQAGAARKKRAECEKKVAEVLAEGNAPKAIELLTEGMRSGGTTAQMLITRATALMKQNRPLAAIRDCTAALKIDDTLVEAYRKRGMTHGKLGHWRKAARDLGKAQAMAFDGSIAEVRKYVDDQVLKAEKASEKQPSSRRERTRAEKIPDPAPPAPYIPPPAPVPALLPELEKGQAVILRDLQKAPHLNGKRGVVEGPDPRPASAGRWEIEIRMEPGIAEVKSLKRENIVTLNKADKVACKAWMTAEKVHKQEKQRREDSAEAAQWRRCVEAKMKKFPIIPDVRELLERLKPQEAAEILDKAEKARQANVNDFLASQARMALDEFSDDGEPGAAPKPAKRARTLSPLREPRKPTKA